MNLVERHISRQPEDEVFVVQYHEYAARAVQNTARMRRHLLRLGLFEDILFFKYVDSFDRMRIKRTYTAGIADVYSLIGNSAVLFYVFWEQVTLVFKEDVVCMKFSCRSEGIGESFPVCIHVSLLSEQQPY